MAYVNSSHFNSLRLCYPRDKKRNETGNWPLLNESWSSFVDWMHDRCWWGSVSEEQIMSFLNRPEVTVGATVIAGYFGDMLGGVCSGMVKTNENTIITFDVYVERGYYKCTEFVQWEYVDPVSMIRDLIEGVPQGYLMARPRAIPDGPNGFSGTHVVEEMRAMIPLLKGAWWGLSTGSSPTSSQHIEVIQALQKKEDEHHTPAAAICHMNEDLRGYLFEIVTAKGKTYKVTFDKSGFTLGTGVHFSTIRALLRHMSTVEHVTFVHKRKDIQSNVRSARIGDCESVSQFMHSVS